MKQQVLPHMASFAAYGERLRLMLEASGSPAAHYVDVRDGASIHWYVYVRETVPLYVYQLEVAGEFGPRLAVYVDAQHPDGRIAFPAVFLEMAEAGKQVVFCVNDALGQSYLFDVSPRGVRLLKEAPSRRFAVEMAYLKHGDSTWSTHDALPDGGDWMYKVKAVPFQKA